MRELTRRDALASATALGAVVVAGCVADNDGDEDDNGADNPDSEPNASSDPDTGGDNGSEQDSPPELELLDTELTTADTTCGSGDMVEASTTDGDLTLEGKVPSSNPCYDAVLDGATLENDTLSVTVRLEEATDGGTCAQCLGVVDYEGTFSFSEDLTDLSRLESVTVDHGGRSGETHTVREAGVVSGQVSRGDDTSSDDGPESAVLANSIETVDRGCTSGGAPGDSPERVDADDETEYSQSGSTVTVQGSVTAATPCHEAYVESVSYDSGQLSLVVGAESNLAPDEYCTECLAEIQYEATVEVAETADVADVSVAHINAGA
jgi:hypothetical protein